MFFNIEACEVPWIIYYMLKLISFNYSICVSEIFFHHLLVSGIKTLQHPWALAAVVMGKPVRDMNISAP